MNLIDKINLFEAGPETVENFNEIFENCSISGFSDSDIVTIGECCSPETCRIVRIGVESFRHNFVPKTGHEVFEGVVVE